MQDNIIPLEQTKQMPRAVKMLSDGLQEAATQTLKNDAETIAKELNLTGRQVREYLKGNVGITDESVKTGKSILNVAREVIKKREQEIKKLVA